MTIGNIFYQKMKSKDKQSIAIIGFGYWGEKLLKVLLEARASMSYLCAVDIDVKKRSLARHYSIDYFSNIWPVFDKVDAIIIATPEHTHYRLAKECLLEKKHVLVEKPFVSTLRQGQELVKLAGKNKVIVMVDSTFLFDSAFNMIKKHVEQKKIGKITRIDSFRCTPNIIKPNTNVVADLFPHDLSIFSEILGRKIAGIEIIHDSLVNRQCDSAAIKLKFGKATTRSFMSWTSPIQRREMLFYGTKGVILWKKKNTNTDLVVNYRYNRRKKLIMRKRQEVGNKQKTLSLVIQEFLQAIKTSKEPRSSGRKILPEIKILESALKKVGK